MLRKELDSARERLKAAVPASTHDLVLQQLSAEKERAGALEEEVQALRSSVSGAALPSTLHP